MGFDIEPRWHVYQVLKEDGSRHIMGVEAKAGPHHAVHVLHEWLRISGPGAAPDSTPTSVRWEALEETVKGETVLALPEPVREAFTAADAAVGVSSARTLEEALSAAVDTALGVVFMAMFATVDLEVIAPIVKGLHEALGDPATKRDLEEVDKASDDPSKPEPPDPSPPPPPDWGRFEFRTGGLGFP